MADARGEVLWGLPFLCVGQGCGATDRERRGRRRALPAAGCGTRRSMGRAGCWTATECGARRARLGWWRRGNRRRARERAENGRREGRGAGRGQQRGCGARRLLGGGPPGAAGRTFWPFSARFTQLRGPRRRRAARAPPATWDYVKAWSRLSRPAACHLRKPRHFWPRTAEWSVGGRGSRTNQASLEESEPGLASSRRQRSRQRHQRGATAPSWEADGIITGEAGGDSARRDHPKKRAQIPQHPEGRTAP